MIEGGRDGGSQEEMLCIKDYIPANNNLLVSITFQGVNAWNFIKTFCIKTNS